MMRSRRPAIPLASFGGSVCNVCIEMEDQAMSLIRNGYAVSTRRGFLGGLFSALPALALFDTGAAAAQEVKQIKLTEKHIQGFMAAYDHIAKIYDGANPDKPDPKLEAQAAAIAKKSGFASLAEYEDASMSFFFFIWRSSAERSTGQPSSSRGDVTCPWLGVCQEALVWSPHPWS